MGQTGIRRAAWHRIASGRLFSLGLLGWSLLGISAGLSPFLAPSPLGAEESAKDRDDLREPVYRVSTAATGLETQKLETRGVGVADSGLEPHPLDEALDRARLSLSHIEQHVRDYTCTLVKRELVQGELLEHEFMACKVRHARRVEGREVPFSVYLGFLKPDSMKGREVIYVSGLNEGKMIAHEGGFKGRLLPTVHLLPTSALAVRGNRYPITEIGIETLTRRLIEKGERDRAAGKCEVRMVSGAKVKNRVCTMLEVKHEDRKAAYDFHLARVFMDDELNLPIRYEAYDWPATPEEQPVLLEEYTYVDLKLNVGLVDADFDSENPRYNF
jgi:hypothetical protein